MDPEGRRLLLALLAIVALVVAAVVGGVLAVTATTGESSTQASVVTSEVGEQVPEPDELVLHVASEGAASEAVGERLGERFRTRGKDVTVADELEADYETPLVIVAVERAEFGGGLAGRTAAVDLVFYYATEGTAEPWRRYRANGSVELDSPGAVVIGEISHQDRTRGLTTGTRYRAGVHDTVAEAVLENYRGALDADADAVRARSR